jgi:hypothetical protein
MFTLARTPRAPLGTITIDSAVPPAEVIENLRIRGKEWRESAVPEDLRKFKVTGLSVTAKGLEFELYWGGDISPLYNPVCFGSVEPVGTGSRINAGFKLHARNILMIGGFASMAIMPLIGGGSTDSWLLAGVMFAILLATVVKNRTAEPMRARLIEMLANAAQQPVKNGLPFSTAMSTNGP